MKGRIHIYEGDGKGKTTAAIGLCIRFAGNGGKVLFTQFLKDNRSGELKILEQLPQVHVMGCQKSFGFTFQMTPGQRREAASYYQSHLKKVLDQAVKGQAGLLVLDEIMAAVQYELVELPVLMDFLENRPAAMEVVLTGRNPASELIELADYVTVMKKVKHPYDQGIGARKGIEQ